MRTQMSRLENLADGIVGTVPRLGPQERQIAIKLYSHWLRANLYLWRGLAAHLTSRKAAFAALSTGGRESTTMTPGW